MKKSKVSRKNVLLTTGQAWVYDFVKNLKVWTSPTKIGKEYGKAVLKKKTCDSSIGSYFCQQLLGLRLFQRSGKGQYKLYTGKK